MKSYQSMICWIGNKSSAEIAVVGTYEYIFQVAELFGNLDVSVAEISEIYI